MTTSPSPPPDVLDGAEVVEDCKCSKTTHVCDNLSGGFVISDINSSNYTADLKESDSVSLDPLPFPFHAPEDEKHVSIDGSSHVINYQRPAKIIHKENLHHPASSSRCPCWRRRVRFYAHEIPPMSRNKVKYLQRFRFGDTHNLKTKNWLLPQVLSCAMTLVGVVLTLIGIISLQINKYLHISSCKDVACETEEYRFSNFMMPIGVGSTGSGVCLIIISGFVFVHAFFVIYQEDEESTRDGTPLSTPAQLSMKQDDSTENFQRSRSFYDNLNTQVL